MTDQVLADYIIGELNDIKTLAKGLSNPLTVKIHPAIGAEIIEKADNILEEMRK